MISWENVIPDVSYNVCIYLFFYLSIYIIDDYIEVPWSTSYLRIWYRIVDHFFNACKLCEKHRNMMCGSLEFLWLCLLCEPASQKDNQANFKCASDKKKQKQQKWVENRMSFWLMVLTAHYSLYTSSVTKFCIYTSQPHKSGHSILKTCMDCISLVLPAGWFPAPYSDLRLYYIMCLLSNNFSEQAETISHVEECRD